MSFKEKALSYTIKLANGVSATIVGLRSTCTIVGSGMPSQMSGTIAIYGMTLERMLQLITYSKDRNLVDNNKLQAFAGDVGGAMTKIFEGTIHTGYVDGLDQPNVAFRMEVLGGAWESVMPSQPTSYQNATDYATVMQQLAQKMGLQLENSLQKKIPIPPGLYLEHSYHEQAKELTQMLANQGAQMVVERGVLAIWTTGNPRQSGGNVKVSYRDGTLVGYPAFNQAGPIITMYFNPSLRMGDSIDVESTITPANGTWYVEQLEYNLAALIPHGPWFCTTQCSAVGQTVPTGDQG